MTKTYCIVDISDFSKQFQNKIANMLSISIKISIISISTHFMSSDNAVMLPKSCG